MTKPAKKIFANNKGFVDDNKHFFVVHLLAVLTTCFYSVWILESQTYADLSLAAFFIPVLGVFSLLSLIAYLHFIHHLRIEARDVIFWAVLIRILMLWVYPIFEDDFFRYMWDGYQTINTGTPYANSPADFFSKENLPIKMEDILGLINHPEIPTIYGPVTQYIFALSAIIAPGEVWPLQLLMLVFDVFVIFLLKAKVKPIYLLLYAWNPLLIKESVITAHPDIIAIALMMFALLLRPRQVFLSACFCALAVSAKVFAILLVPFALKFNLRAWVVFSVVLLATFLPFVDSLLGWYTSLSAMGQQWLFNSPLYLVSASIWGAGVLGGLKVGALGIYCIFWLVLFCRHLRNEARTGETIPRGDVLYLAFLLVMPVANPWYFLWIMPFVAIYPSVWGWVCSGAVLLSYFIGLNMPNTSLASYQQPGWAITLEYVLIFLAIAFSYYRSHRLRVRRGLANDSHRRPLGRN